MNDSITIKGIHHLGLTVADVDETRRFFEGARHLECNIPGGIRVEFISPTP